MFRFNQTIPFILLLSLWQWLLLLHVRVIHEIDWHVIWDIVGLVDENYTCPASYLWPFS